MNYSFVRELIRPLKAVSLTRSRVNFLIQKDFVLILKKKDAIKACSRDDVKL